MTAQLDFSLLPLHIAIVGSRSYWKQTPIMNKVVERFVSKLREGTIVASGGAIGIDKWAEQHAKSLGLGFVDFYPKPEEHDNNYIKACFARNTQIAEWAKEHNGVVIAFADPLNSRGTDDTLTKAMKRDVPFVKFMYSVNAIYMGWTGEEDYFIRE